MEQELDVAEALESDSSYVVKGNTLTMYGPGGAIVLLWLRT